MQEKLARYAVSRYSARGDPFVVLDPMPRIQDIYLDNVAYLYTSVEEAKAGVNIGGSGFLVGVPCTTFPMPNGFLYAVTNRHVIKSGCECIRLNTADGAMDAFSLKGRWICSETDDLAVCMLPKFGVQLRTRIIPNSWLITEKMIREHDIGIGDEVIVLGRFINREGVQRNSPAARFGFISQMLDDPIEIEIEGKLHLQECFLVEVKSIGGYSGSPVLLIPDPKVGRDGTPFPDNITFVLGVDCAHILDWEDVFDDKGYRLPHLRVRINTGMMAVIPAWKVEALLNSEKAVAQRTIAEQREHKRRSAPKASTDVSAIGGLPSTDANPNHRGDFKSLVNAAGRKRPQGDQT